ncbi:predicted protein [Lichtheimia corymbifera JMRC:FSU:9682]|uniref:Uncharacterized protein n=1 Tax=Lichtheimia corymbifera JMRC:FSU:9682 TaxID=1263082 RepID=A0A068SG15_9FUNG|nr:predicted protein [Lichtheimia corymbifera JMRC:FSU:9682]
MHAEGTDRATPTSVQHTPLAMATPTSIQHTPLAMHVKEVNRATPITFHVHRWRTTCKCCGLWPRSHFGLLANRSSHVTQYH